MHASTPFPTWHRPYMALYEVSTISNSSALVSCSPRILLTPAHLPLWLPSLLIRSQQTLWNHAQLIASTYSDDQHEQYVEAALNLRHPYWDWVLYPELPDVVSQSSVKINTPDGWQTIDNPLYQYIFQADAAGNGFPLGDPVCNDAPFPGSRK